MRRAYSLALLAALVFLSSCRSTLPGRFESFVATVEETCSNSSYSEEYWMRTDDKFRKLYDEFQENRSSFSSDLKREINSRIARYEYLRVNSIVSYVEENSFDFSEDDWISANERVMELAREYKENRHSYNSAEKKRIDSVLMHYLGLVIKSKIPGVLDKIMSLLRELGL